MKNWNLKELKWVGMDFDGSLAFTSPDNDYSLDNAEVNYELIKAMRKDYKRGKRFIIHTARHWDEYILIEAWLHKHRVPYKAIICGKLLAGKYVDDRALRPEEYIKEVNNGKKFS